MKCPNCGHSVAYHGKDGCNEGDRSWSCGCKDTKFHRSRLTEKEEEIYRRGVLAGKARRERR